MSDYKAQYEIENVCGHKWEIEQKNNKKTLYYLIKWGFYKNEIPVWEKSKNIKKNIKITRYNKKYSICIDDETDIIDDENKCFDDTISGRLKRRKKRGIKTLTIEETKKLNDLSKKSKKKSILIQSDDDCDSIIMPKKKKQKKNNIIIKNEPKWCFKKTIVNETKIYTTKDLELDELWKIAKKKRELNKTKDKDNRSTTKTTYLIINNILKQLNWINNDTKIIDFTPYLCKHDNSNVLDWVCLYLICII